MLPDKLPAWAAPAAVLAMGLALTAAATGQLLHARHLEDEARFTLEASRLEERIRSRLRQAEILLSSAAGVAGAESFPSAESLRIFAADDEAAGSRLPGIAWTLRVTKAGLDEFVLAMRNRGYPDFLVDSLGEREEYEPLVGREPWNYPWPEGLGYDVYADAVRQECMDQARDTGRTSLTRPVAVPPGGGPDAWLVAPYYIGARVPDSLDGRRALLRGFVLAPLRWQSLFAVPAGGPALVVEDVSDGREAVILFRHGAGEGAVGPSLETVVPVGARQWRLIFTAPGPGPGHYRAAWAVLALGSLSSLILAGAALGLELARRRGGVRTAALEAEKAGLALEADHLRARLEALARQAPPAPAEVAGLREALRRQRQALRLERERRGRVEADEQAKDEFLATLSHELRIPLNAMRGWSESLLTGDADRESLLRGMEQIGRNARAQGRLIDDLLDTAEIVAGRLGLERHPVALAPVIRAAADVLVPDMEARQIVLNCDLEDRGLAVDGDTARLQQVVCNLLSNAVKFSPPGGHIGVALKREGRQAVIVVSDEGEGIPADFLPYVFNRFRQADASTRRKHGGLGLGLAIARDLVELHGGTVAVESPGPGQGATFRIGLPLLDGTASLPDEPPAPAAHAGRLDGLRILAVDDDRSTREMLQEALQRAGAQVCCAATAAEALVELGRFQPDVLLADIGLPGQDGYALMHQVRGLPPGAGGNLPAVALTGYAREEDRNACLDAGFQAFMVKPVELAPLFELIAALAGSGAGTSAETGRSEKAA